MALLSQVAIMLCKHGTPPLKKRTVPGDLLYVGHRTEKSFREALVPDLAITHARVIPEHASHVREREPVPPSRRCSAARLPRSGVAFRPAVRGREARGDQFPVRLETRRNVRR